MKNRACLFAVLSVVVVSLLLLGPAPRALADSPRPPEDYAKETENGKYVFVMLASEPWDKYQRNSAVRKKYRQSGMYRNDGSTTPLWTVPWFSFGVYPSSDGRHLVQMGPWASDPAQLAVAFHRDGRLIKAYAIQDLVVDKTRLRYTVSHFFWSKSVEFDDKQSTLLIATTDGRSYRFSIKTGEVLQAGAGQNVSPEAEQ